ncbi:MAG: glycosyltransferase 87 family protein [Planctomycetota bacterium]
MILEIAAKPRGTSSWPAALMVFAGVGVVLLASRISALPDARGALPEYLSLWTAWFGCLILGGWVMRRVAVSNALVWLLVVAIAARLGLIVMPASLSDDWVRYLWDGRLVTKGWDPYAAVPSDPSLAAMDDGFLLHAMNSPDYFTVYPPVSQAFFALAWWLGGGDSARALVALRCLFAAVDSIACVLLIVWLKSLRLDPRLAVWYAWSPIAVVELVGGTHSEALLAAPMIGCLLALRGKRDALAGGLLAVAVWVKLFPILSVLLLSFRVGWRRALRAGTVCLLVGLLIGWPMLRPTALSNVLDSLGLYAGVFSFNHGPFVLLWSAWDTLASDFRTSPYEDSTRILLVVFATWVCWQWWRSRRLFADTQADRQLARAVAAIFGAYVVANANVHPWSLAWALPLIPALGQRWIAAWAWFSFWTGFSYLAYDAEPIAVPPWVLAAEWGGFTLLAVWAWRGRRAMRSSPRQVVL